MKPIVSELKKLERGIILELRDNDKIIRKNIQFYLIAGVFDKPAKASVLNMISYNGFGGCTKCLQLGETHTTANGN